MHNRSEVSNSPLRKRNAESPTSIPVDAGLLTYTASSSSPSAHPEAATSSTPQPLAHMITDALSLNMADPVELRKHEHLLTADQLACLNMIQIKAQAWPQKFDRPADHYPETAAIIAMSDWPHAHRYCYCSIGQRFCHQWKLCPLCSYHRKRQALCAYLPRFGASTWQYLTISFHGRFVMEGYEDCDVYWDACAEAIRGLVAAGKARGACWREELALVGLLPVRVMPHVHAIVDADSVGAEDVVGAVLKYRDGYEESPHDKVKKPPSVNVQPVQTRPEFARLISYNNKCLDLCGPYAAAWPKAAAKNRARAWVLREDVNDFLAGFACATEGRCQVRYVGSLHPRHGHYVGIPKGKRSWRRTRALLEC
jgi:hypothetical protein